MPIPPPPVRLEAVRHVITEAGLDGVLISDPDNRYYVSGYLADDHGPTESSGVVLIGGNLQAIYTSPNNTAWASSEAPDFETLATGRPWERSVSEAMIEAGWKQVGIEAESLSVGSLQRLTDASESIEFVPLGDGIDRLRWVKDQQEIDQLQRVITLTDEALATVLPSLEPGQSERSVASRIVKQFLDAGASGAAFPIIVGSGPNGARPHHSTGGRVIMAGEPVVIDMGARLDGYCGDLTRTISLGAPDKVAREVFDIVAEAQLAALSTIKAGAEASAPDIAARNLLENAGWGDQILHSVGHGLGIRVHDGPSLSRVADYRLESGNVVTVEPGLYVHDLFGVRIEDVVVVTDDGYQKLSDAPVQLDIR